MMWQNGRAQQAPADGTDLAALCSAVEQAVKAHGPGGRSVRAVIVMVDQPAPVVDAVEASPACDAGYGHGV